MSEVAVRHSGQLYFRRRLRDLGRKTWWVECIHCGKRMGPYPDRGFARFVVADLWGTFGVGQWCDEERAGSNTIREGE